MRIQMLRLIIIALFISLMPACFAGIRAPGKYSGVVIFDRWDGCILFSGVYLMYVSEKTKAALRPYIGQPVQIDAKQVYQPINPGDGLIGKFAYLGPATNEDSWIKLDGIRLTGSISVNTNGKPIGALIIKNSGNAPVKIFTQELALTVLKKKETKAESSSWVPSDGPSYALITRQDFDGREGGGGIEAGTSYSWTIGKRNALPHDFELEAGTQRVLTIYLDLPDGEYDFLGGYAGDVHETKCLASNLSAFDIKHGRTIIR